jgi:hypothetical protein
MNGNEWNMEELLGSTLISIIPEIWGYTMAEDVQTLSTSHADCREQQAQLKTYGGVFHGSGTSSNIDGGLQLIYSIIQCIYIYTYSIYILVGGLEHFLFFHVLGIIIPTD